MSFRESLMNQNYGYSSYTTNYQCSNNFHRNNIKYKYGTINDTLTIGSEFDLPNYHPEKDDYHNYIDDMEDYTDDGSKSSFSCSKLNHFIK